jgi:2-polyprenyl-3-methyl-5-hydroxy-6-metoxy-1,4-benzoquinol methylase
MKDSTVCPICGDSNSRQLYCFEPARWIPGSVVRCDTCEILYKIPSAGAKRLADYYDQSYTESNYWNHEQVAIRSFREIIDSIVDTLGTTSLSLLDVGCGPGTFLSLAQQVGFDVTGLELNSELANKAHTKTGLPVIIGDLMSAELSDRRFDVIAMLDLIEHLADPVSVLRRCYELLKAGGSLVVYTPNHNSLIVWIADLLYRLSRGRMTGPVTEIFDCTHVVFFDAQTLRLALAKAGFTVTKSILFKYDPSRSEQATGISALGLRAVEAISPLINGQFRLLMFARQ